ncbi:DNA-binding transcriptional MerR regulator [Virgibacillus natechei]|uniref:DNA-binding transcriptional MerR regulator n=1 Tax=Virgibacillus natechei TaxID=1216297 RepID=A0ABS4II65_9BACI|nr:anti-repressor SinI family protein [Virgibacillus natechei]MBP1970026.1 DNA-binding transcriptional MerR regulator [Virgibacillus natechei]UZD13320.1 anti-repressor SinI family protein [Virgibacillus natechei]
MKHISDGWIKLIVEAKQLGLTHSEVREILQKGAGSNAKD